jgi:hypothetical protein
MVDELGAKREGIGGYLTKPRQGVGAWTRASSSGRFSTRYAYPARHWELDTEGQPTNHIIETRRRCDLITPVPEPQRRRLVAPGIRPLMPRHLLFCRPADEQPLVANRVM